MESTKRGIPGTNAVPQAPQQPLPGTAETSQRPAVPVDRQLVAAKRQSKNPGTRQGFSFLSFLVFTWLSLICLVRTPATETTDGASTKQHVVREGIA